VVTTIITIKEVEEEEEVLFNTNYKTHDFQARKHTKCDNN
jgi:hypothetical protein